MDPKLEQNFANLSIPIRGLREHADRHGGKILLPDSLPPPDKEDIRLDLESALQAARSGDVDWLTGKEIVAEVNNDDSPYHSRSAFQAFSRAAAFEAILVGREGRFAPCPNQTIEFLATPVKAIRDEQFRKKMGELFPETVADRTRYLHNVEAGLVAARGDNDIDELTGAEVLRDPPGSETNALCNNIESLDLFWQTALVNAWLEGRPTLDVVNILSTPVAVQPPPPTGPTPPALPTIPRSPTIPWAPSSPWASTPWVLPPGASFPVPSPTIPSPTIPAPPGAASQDVDVQIVEDWLHGTTDAAFFGGGLYFQRGVIGKFNMYFKPLVGEGKPPQLVLEKVDYIQAKRGIKLEDSTPGSPPAYSEPLDPQEFQSRNKKMYEKARKEAQEWWRRTGQASDVTLPPVTDVERGWIKGIVGGRRLAGWGAMAVSAVDAALRLFRDDGRGLDGPLTDAGLDPLGGRLALMGAGVGAAAVTILTGGLSLVAALVLGGGAAVGGGLETYAAFEEEGALKFESEFIPMRDRDSWLGKPGRSTTQPDLLARLNEPTCKSRRADSYIWDSNSRVPKI